MVEPFQLILINFCIYSKEQIFKLCGLTDKVGYLPDGIAHIHNGHSQNVGATDQAQF